MNPTLRDVHTTSCIENAFIINLIITTSDDKKQSHQFLPHDGLTRWSMHNDLPFDYWTILCKGCMLSLSLHDITLQWWWHILFWQEFYQDKISQLCYPNIHYFGGILIMLWYAHYSFYSAWDISWFNHMYSRSKVLDILLMKNNYSMCSWTTPLLTWGSCQERV